MTARGRATIELARRTVRRVGPALAAMVVASAALGIFRHAAAPAQSDAGRPSSMSLTPPPLTRDAEAGRLLFEQLCILCHGQAGDGFGINAPNLPVPVPALRDTAARADAKLMAIIAGGGAGVGRSHAMPAWGGRLQPRDIQALVAYIRALP